MAVPSTEQDPAGVAGSRDILQGILDASRESLLIVDTSMRIAAANDPARSAFGRQNIELRGRRLSEIIRDPRLHESFERVLNEDTSIGLRIEFTAHEKRIYDVHISQIELDSRRHAIGAFYDITPMERLEKVRQEFLSNISHELRTPLTSILAYVETLEDGAIDDTANNRRFLNVIRRNAERMHSLIADIAELSLIETGNVSIDVKELNLSQVLEDIYAALSSRAETRQVELVTDVPAEAVVRADRVRLEQMLTNLVDNAIKFNREGGTVTVSFSELPDKSLISVTDTGDGITAENLQRVFERFYRIDRGRTRDVGGTGLGLAIVKHLAKLHGGNVVASSTLGRGTTFTIELPNV